MEKSKKPVNDHAGAESALDVGLAAETARADQLAKNCMWLIAKIDRIHAALCQGENGSWQMRAEQAANAAERKAANSEVSDCLPK